jgi:hypothetical protein
MLYNQQHTNQARISFTIFCSDNLVFLQALAADRYYYDVEDSRA